MSDEMRRPGAQLPPTAATALLTLRLRAALQDAEAAEVEEAAFDVEAQRRGAAAELDRLVEQRRTALSAELDEARRDAARRVGVAEADSEQLRAAARARADEALAAAPPPLVVSPLPSAETLMADHTASDGATSDDIWLPAAAVVEDTSTVDPWSEFAPPVPASSTEIESAVQAAVAQSIVVDRWADVPAARYGDQSQAVVTVDAEAFARVFATVLATVLDERFAAWRSGMVGPLAPQALVAPAPEQKPSLARRFFHVDLILSVLAGAIVLVLLFAWLG